MATAEQITALAQQQRRIQSLASLGNQQPLSIAAQQRGAATSRPLYQPPALNTGDVRGGARLDGSQNYGGNQGDDRLDGSQNISPLAAAANAAPVSSSPLASYAAPDIATAGNAMPGTQDALYGAQKAALDRGESLANGGRVRGPGTGTSDSIHNVNLSNDEIVIPADVARRPEVAKTVAGWIRDYHKPVPKKPDSFANGRVLDADGNDVTDWNKFVDTQQQPPAATSTQVGAGPNLAMQPIGPNLALSPLANYSAPSAPDDTPDTRPALADMTRQLVRQSSRQPSGPSLLAQTIQQGRAEGRQSVTGQTPQSMVRAVDNAQLASPLAAGVTPTTARPGYALASTMPNATAGQAQVRAVDNPLAAAADQADQDAMGQRMEAARQGTNYATAGNGFALRDAIKGGTTPGMTFNSNYGYGDNIKATADGSGKVNSFSGTTSPQAAEAFRQSDLANYSQGLARAAANREQLAGIEAKNNAIPILAQMTPAQQIAATEANATNARTGALTREAQQQTINGAGRQPYSLANAAADMGKTQAQTAGIQEETGSKKELSPYQVQEAQQKVKGGQFALQMQQHMADLQKRATGSGPDAQNAVNQIALIQKAQSGKGGPITDEDILGAHKDMVVRAIQMGGPDALKSLPSFNEYKQQLLGTGNRPASLQDFLTKARPANPGMSDTQLTQEYQKRYGGV